MLFIQRKILILILIVAIGVGFGGGFVFFKFKNGDTLASLPLLQNLINLDSGKPQDVDFSLFWEVWNTVSSKYVDPTKIDKQKMLYGAINGMVESIGDPYTVFFEPVISKKFKEEISGSFGGVGIEIGKRDGILTVISPIKDTPAYKAGIKAGDRVLAVDSKSTADLTIEEAVNLIRGKVGEKVVLTIAREGESKTIDIEVVRDNIKIPTVEWKMVGDKTAYIQIYSFNRNVDDDFEKTVEEITKAGAKSIIVDLRNNPGGLLDSSINLAGWFVEEGRPVVYEEFRDKTRNEFASTGNATLKSYPTILLINGGSASASEILAGALHDNLGIKIVGEKSFGKGSVQELEDFGNGSSLKVTIAKWLTPLGRSITDVGIDPDIEVKIGEEEIKNGFEFGTPGKDSQLDKALELLK